MIDNQGVLGYVLLSLTVLASADLLEKCEREYGRVL